MADKSNGAHNALAQAIVPNHVMRANKRSSICAGFISGSGEFITTEALRKSNMQIVLGDNNAVQFKALSGDGITMQTSKEVRDDDNAFDSSRDGTVNPAYSFETLETLYASNVVHSAAIETKADDIAYNGWELKSRPEAADVNQNELDAAYEYVHNFLTSCVNGAPIDDLLHDSEIDRSVFGCRAIEVLRNSKGFVAGLNHIPFRNMRILRQKVQSETGLLAMQKRFENKAMYFVPFGANITYNASFDPLMAPLDEFPMFAQRENILKLAESFRKVGSRTETTSEFNDAATEVIIDVRPPLYASVYYGTPAATAAFDSMIAQMHIDTFNRDFFKNKGVPQYAVIFENVDTAFGAPMADADEFDDTGAIANSDPLKASTLTSELIETVTSYFRTNISAGNRSVLVLTLSDGAKVRFEKLSSDLLDASFAEYEKRCTDKVRMAHKIPPGLIGLVDTPVVGDGSYIAQMQRYRDHIITPGQRKAAALVNKIIKCGLLIPYFEFELSSPETNDLSAEREFVLKEFINGIITLDMYLEATGRDTLGAEAGGNLRVMQLDKVLDLEKITEAGGTLFAEASRAEAAKRMRNTQTLADVLLEDEALYDAVMERTQLQT